MSVINSTPLLAAAGGDYQISRSVRLRSSASAYFNRTPASAGNRKTWTWSGWVKRGRLTASAVGSEEQHVFVSGGSTTSDATYFRVFFLGVQQDCLGVGVYNTVFRVSSATFRDPSSWYHIIIAFDSTQATAQNRLRLYVNGNELTNFQINNAVTLNSDYGVNAMNAHEIGRESTYGRYFDGYLTEVNFIDGQALTPSSFGETDAVTGVWKPKKYTGTYGTNGFYLNFSDPSAATAAAIGKDSSGNGNNWTPNNISVTAGVTYDSMLDVPTMWADGGNGRGNYAVLNPVWKSSTASTSNANLTLSQTAVLDVNQTTMGVSSGKWYWEATINSVGATPTPMIGVVKGGGLDAYTSANAYYYYGNSGQKFISGSASAYGATYTTNDVVGVALDMDAGTLTFYKNNTSQGTATTGLAGKFFPAFSNGGGPTPSWSAALNFGQRPFAYTPPTGFKALNTQNLPEATIKKGNQFFDVVTRNGFGASGGSFSTTLDMTQGGLLWEKPRNSAGSSNYLWDSVRGINANSPYLISNSTAAEATTGNWITSFNNGSISVDSDDWIAGVSVVDWIWKESVTAGFDIVTYTGTGANRTVAHSLGVAPKMMIVKNRDSALGWCVYHANLPSAQYGLILNTTQAQDNTSNYWAGTAPTSSVFSVGTLAHVNGNGNNIVAYLFAEVAGFSKFGSYTGNGSADGPFVFTGFKPRYIMWKRTDAAGASWNIYDTARSAYNASTADLFANLSNAESTQGVIDILSNGWKVRDAGGAELNASGGTYIFAAFAENPFKNSLAR